MPVEERQRALGLTLQASSRTAPDTKSGREVDASSGRCRRSVRVDAYDPERSESLDAGTVAEGRSADIKIWLVLN